MNGRAVAEKRQLYNNEVCFPSTLLFPLGSVIKCLIMPGGLPYKRGTGALPPKGYCKGFRRGPFEAAHPKRH